MVFNDFFMRVLKIYFYFLNLSLIPFLFDLLCKCSFNQILFDFKLVVGAVKSESNEDRNENYKYYAPCRNNAFSGNPITPEEESHTHPEEHDDNEKAY